MYKERLKRLANFELLIIPDLKNTKKMPPEQVKVKEGTLIMKILTNTDFVVLLDEKGRSLNSHKFAGFIENKLSVSTKQLVFIVGGAYGFSKEIYKSSPFTSLFPISELKGCLKIFPPLLLDIHYALK